MLMDCSIISSGIGYLAKMEIVSGWLDILVGPEAFLSSFDDD